MLVVAVPSDDLNEISPSTNSITFPQIVMKTTNFSSFLLLLVGVSEIIVSLKINSLIAAVMF